MQAKSAYHLYQTVHSPLFFRGIVYLTATAILIFKCTEGAGAGDYARWQSVTQSARSRRSYGKIEDCEQSTFVWETENFGENSNATVHPVGNFPEKSNTYLSRYYLFPFFTETTEIFCIICLDYQCQASSREKAKNLPVFL